MSGSKPHYDWSYLRCRIWLTFILGLLDVETFRIPEPFLSSLIGYRLMLWDALDVGLLHAAATPSNWLSFGIMTYGVGSEIFFLLFFLILLVCFDGWFPPKRPYIFQTRWCLYFPSNYLPSFPSLTSSFRISNPQLAAFFSSTPPRLRICFESYIPNWENHFPVPQPKQEPVVVERAMSNFTMECGVTRVNTHLCSSINVEHMLSRVFMGKMFG